MEFRSNEFGFARGAFAVIIGILSITLVAEGSNQPGQLAASPDGALAPKEFVASANYPAIAPQNDIAKVQNSGSKLATSLWITSLGAMAAATSLDASTSYGKREANSLLASSNGTFGTKSVLLKAGLSGGTIVSEILLRKRKKAKVLFTAANIALAGAFTEVARHNLSVAAPK